MSTSHQQQCPNPQVQSKHRPPTAGTLTSSLSYLSHAAFLELIQTHKGRHRGMQGLVMIWASNSNWRRNNSKGRPSLVPKYHRLSVLQHLDLRMNLLQIITDPQTWGLPKQPCRPKARSQRDLCSNSYCLDHVSCTSRQYVSNPSSTQTT
jgi:hypothetical protein